MKASILIIDDDPYIINLLEKYFQREGYKVLTSFKGKPALKLLQKEVLMLSYATYDCRISTAQSFCHLYGRHRPKRQ
jgi:DNA-binding response OmpR family regulator